MRNVATQAFSHFRLPKGFLPLTHAELSGLDPMLVPTTQIKIDPQADAPWHRRGPEESMTACGLFYNGCAIRAYVANVAGLCEDCFTPFERKLPTIE